MLLALKSLKEVCQCLLYNSILEVGSCGWEKYIFLIEFVSAEFWNLKYSFNIKTLFSVLLKTASDTAAPIVKGQKFV